MSTATAKQLTDPTTIVDKVGPKLLHVPYEPLRAHLVNNVVGHRMIPWEHLYDEDETDIQKRKKDREAMYSLAAFVHYSDRLIANPAEEIEPDDEDDKDSVAAAAALRAAYTQLVSLVLSEKEQIERETKVAFEAQVVTFDQLSFGLAAGYLFAIRQEGVLVCMQVQSAEPQESFFGRFLQIEGRVYGWNGKEFTAGLHTVKVGAFDDVKTFDELNIEVVTPEIHETLVTRGRRYVDLNRTPHYVNYAGTLLQRGYWSNQRYNANGRIMIDVASMQRAQPNYDKWFAEIEPNNGRRGQKEPLSNEKISGEVLACMSPYVYGFSFVSKAWGEMLVDNVSEIQFRNDAYDKLVLDKDSKDMVLALVQAEDLHSADFIDGKGGGCIFLLAGNPGCGKTLTAEAVAEKLHRPLYAVGIGELGTEVKSLETSLVRILETAAVWNAVLLLDEADIFLEERSDLNIERNAMVGVFLRLLEYYPGILFLTSNRASNLDKAFASRISLALAYEDLSQATRRVVWGNITGLYNKAGSVKKIDLTDADLDTLAAASLNGRQIKNVVRIALVLATQANRQVELSDFQRVIERTKAFNN
jgi:hypothetical protein